MSDENVGETPATSDEEQPEEELRDRYLEQLRRLSCPECGEGEEVF